MRKVLSKVSSLLTLVAFFGVMGFAMKDSHAGPGDIILKEEAVSNSFHSGRAYSYTNSGKKEYYFIKDNYKFCNLPIGFKIVNQTKSNIGFLNNYTILKPMKVRFYGSYIASQIKLANGKIKIQGTFYLKRIN